MRWTSLRETRFHRYHCRACCLGRSTSRLSTVEIPSCQQCSTEVRIAVTVVTSRLHSQPRRNLPWGGRLSRVVVGVKRLISTQSIFFDRPPRGYRCGFRNRSWIAKGIDGIDNFHMALRGVSLLHASVICGILVLGSASASGQDLADKTKQVFDRENTYVTAEVATRTFRGAVLVGMDGKIVFEKAYGLADEEWGVRNTLTTKFRIGSLTKQFTAACVLLLQERGRLNVHDPVSRYLLDLPNAWRAI